MLMSSRTNATRPMERGHLTLNQRALHLWVTRLPRKPFPPGRDHRTVMVDGAEKRRIAGLRFDVDRYTYMWTRMFTRITLSRYAAVHPREWRFSQGRFGRPYVASPAGLGIE